jgi:hypothetical protein
LADITAQGIVKMRRENYADVSSSSVFRCSSTLVVDFLVLVNEKSTITSK